jgi:hypothetical protein
VTLSDDNPTKPAKVQYTMYVIVQLKPKAANITISEVKKPVVIPKSALKQLEATISSISMKGKVTVRFSKQL